MNDDDLNAWANAVWERVRLRSLVEDQIREIALALGTERDRAYMLAKTVSPMKNDSTAEELRQCIMDAIENGYGSPYYRDR